MSYATNTNVTPERSRMEIEATLRKYGADSFAYASMVDRAVIGFEARGRRVRFEVPLPDPKDEQFLWVKHARRHQRTRRTDAQAQQAWQQACWSRWRALALCIKAKLEAVESGITEFEDEFLAHIVLPNGSTVGDHVRPGLERAYSDGKVPPLLGQF